MAFQRIIVCFRVLEGKSKMVFKFTLIVHGTFADKLPSIARHDLQCQATQYTCNWEVKFCKCPEKGTNQISAHYC